LATSEAEAAYVKKAVDGANKYIDDAVEVIIKFHHSFSIGAIFQIGLLEKLCFEKRLGYKN